MPITRRMSHPAAGNPDGATASPAVVAGRGLLLALLGWWTLSFVLHPLSASWIIGSFLHLIALPFHEAGHVIFAPFGEFLQVLGGSLFQVIVPIVCAVALARRGDRFGTAVCAWWAGACLVDLGPYIADARALQITLIGGRTGAEVYGHDWEAILQALGWLHRDRALGMTAHVVGSAVMVAAFVLAVRLIRVETRAED